MRPATRVVGLLLLAVVLLLLTSSVFPNTPIPPIGSVQASTSCPGSTNAFGALLVTGNCYIATNTVWGNGTLTLAGNLTVNGGATLTLWSLVIKFSSTAQDQHSLAVSGALRMSGGSLQSNDAYHWYLISYGNVRIDRANVSRAGYGTQAGLDLAGPGGNQVTRTHVEDARVEMLSNHNDYFGYNNLSNYDDSANGNNHVLWIGANSTVEHNTFWNVTLGTQSAIMSYRNYGNTRIFANSLYLRANGSNAMGIEVINDQHQQTAVYPGRWVVETTWNNISWLSTASGSNSHALDNEFSEREWIANNTVTVQPPGASTECLQAGGMTNSLIENNVCRGRFSYGIYDYIYDTAFNTFRGNTIDGAQNGIILQAGNNTITGNTFANLTGTGVWECSSAPCAGSTAATTHNLYVGNTYTWQQGSAATGNLVNVQVTNYLANTFIGHAGPLNPATRYRVGSSYYAWNGNWLYWANQAVNALQWANSATGTRCLTVTLSGQSPTDCVPSAATSNAALAVTGPIDSHGSVDLVNHPEQVSVLYGLSRGNASFSLKTARPGVFWFNLTGVYPGTYRVSIYNYTGSKWETSATAYASDTGALTYHRALSGFYNVSIGLVNGSSAVFTAPTVVTSPASNVGESNATMNASLTDLGTAPRVTIGFLYATNASLAGAMNVTAATETGTANVGTTVAGLIAGTTYYFAAWGLGDGFSMGGVLAFTTSSAPVSTPPTPSPSVLGVAYNPGTQELDILFSEAMNQVSVTNAISIQPSTAFQEIWPSGSHIQLQLTSPLNGTTEYSLTVASTALSVSGQALEGAFTFRFMASSAAAAPTPPTSSPIPNWLPWMTIALAAALILALMLHRRSRRKIRALRQTARVLARRVEELKGAGARSSPRALGTTALKPVQAVRATDSPTRFPTHKAGNP